jgi:hypothetical protein
MAREGLPDLIAEKQRLENELEITPVQQTNLFNEVTADSSYRRHGV